MEDPGKRMMKTLPSGKIIYSLIYEVHYEKYKANGWEDAPDPEPAALDAVESVVKESIDADPGKAAHGRLRAPVKDSAAEAIAIVATELRKPPVNSFQKAIRKKN